MDATEHSTPEIAPKPQPYPLEFIRSLEHGVLNYWNSEFIRLAYQAVPGDLPSARKKVFAFGPEAADADFGAVREWAESHGFNLTRATEMEPPPSTKPYRTYLTFTFPKASTSKDHALRAAYANSDYPGLVHEELRWALVRAREEMDAALGRARASRKAEV